MAHLAQHEDPAVFSFVFMEGQTFNRDLTQTEQMKERGAAGFVIIKAI